MKNYQGRRLRRRKGFRRRPTFRKKLFYKKVRRAVNRMAEHKTTYALNYSTTTVTSSGYLQNLCIMSQGVSRVNRVGNRVFLKYLRLRLTLYSNNAGGIVWKYAVVIPRATGSLAIGDFPTTALEQPYNYSIMKVLYQGSCHTGGMDTTDGGIRPLDLHIPINHSANFDDNAGNIPIDCQILLFVWNNDLITPSPYITYAAYLSFTDV